jgi:hypothetical protein
VSASGGQSPVASIASEQGRGRAINRSSIAELAAAILSPAGDLPQAGYRARVVPSRGDTRDLTLELHPDGFGAGVSASVAKLAITVGSPAEDPSVAGEAAGVRGA